MLKIKLAQIGKSGGKSFRVIVSEARQKRNGKVLETIGFYDPKTRPETIRINRQKLEQWEKRGAKLTEGIRKLISK